MLSGRSGLSVGLLNEGFGLIVECASSPDPPMQAKQDLDGIKWHTNGAVFITLNKPNSASRAAAV